MTGSWSPIALDRFLSRSEDWVDIDAVQVYREVTVRLWGKGVAERRQVLGAEIGSGRRLRVRPGQFILSRIDARNGAFGIVPNELDGAVVSNDFPAFIVDQSVVLPSFLLWVSRTQGFVDICQTASEGTTNRVRLQETRFLSSCIMIPPLGEQRRIVARIDELAAKIEEARGLRREALQAADALLHAELRSILTQHNPTWPRLPIADVASINPPRRDQATRLPPEVVSFVPMSAVDDVSGRIQRPETRRFTEVSKGHTWFQDGDVIFARITPCMQNGKAALVSGLVNGIGLGSTEFHVLRPGPQVTGQWLHSLVRHKDFRDDAARHFKGTAGQQRVPQSFLEQKIIAVPPLEEQHRIVAHLSQLELRVNELRLLQAETAAELDALLPSILEKAFKGEL